MQFQPMAGILLLAVSCLIGCSGNGLCTLHGVVTIDGKPAPEGTMLEFQSLSEGGSTAYGTTDAQGNYEAMFSFNQSGIQPGEHVVRLMPAEVTVFADDGTRLPASQNPLKKLPARYFTEIEKISVSSGSNTIDFELETDK
ncbi:hypothetical protein [Bremerella cremea]|uniref:hypothetical protein n=1 Tax=Bremerella cremea TaxID=1031537 RepID=UPI0031EDB6B4